MDWTPVVPEADLIDGKPIHVAIEDAEVFVCRVGDRIFALDDRCTHQGGPLHRGVVRGGPKPSVTCPIHSSAFWLTDGRVIRPPASRPQPVYEVRMEEGLVQVRPQAAGV